MLRNFMVFSIMDFKVAAGSSMRSASDFPGSINYVERGLDSSAAISGDFFLRHFRAQTLYPLLSLGREILSEIGSLKKWTDLHLRVLAMRIRTTLQPFHRFFHRTYL